MASRINIENSLWSDYRYEYLCEILGKFEAAGRLLYAFKLAQTFWARNQRTIPKSVWDMNKLGQELIDCNLAQYEDGGIYVCGSEEQFAWLLKRQSAGRTGGIKSGEKRKINNLHEANVKQTEANTKQTSSKTKPLTLTLSLSPTLALTNTNIISDTPSGAEQKKTVKLKSKKLKDPTEGTKVLNAYRDAIKTRYDIEIPEPNDVMRSQAVNFIKRIGQTDASKITEFYVLNMHDQWLIKAKHPFGNLLKTWESVRAHWLSGSATTTVQAQHIENKIQILSEADKTLQRRWGDSCESTK